MKPAVKLACKAGFIRFSPSGGRPMLLVRRKTGKKKPVNRDDLTAGRGKTGKKKPVNRDDLNPLRQKTHKE